ncbi:MAG TPA: twin-arginine translocase TatA/TatE family subunit [Pirellulales bacterium]|jgi:sec-independent protein translocase protein TatA
MQLLAFVNPWELAVVAVVALLLFGTRLPGVARSLGKSITEFKKGVKGIEDDAEEAPKLQR